ncbi:MAG: DNA repair protein RecO [Bacteroidota bacterium]|nr:DNA repair protein RecO [Bacteroidota bacterium]
MLQATSGIILHTTKYSETSLIAKIYTRDFGLRSCIVSGVRSKRSKNKAAIFQPLAIVDLVISTSGKGGLQRISEISVQHPYSTIPYDIIKSSIAIFLNEIIYRSVKEDHPDESLFDFLKTALLILDLKTESTSNFHIYFMVQMSRYLGFYPQGTCHENSIFDLREGRFTETFPTHSQSLDPELSNLLYQLISVDFEGMSAIRVNKTQRRQLLQGLIDYYRLHISNLGEIRSKDVLEDVIG